MSKSIEWETMTPEQRDALVAEKVMGYKTGIMPLGDIAQWNHSGLIEPIPCYTQSMDAAWVVLQKMAAHEDGEMFYRFRQLLLNDIGDEIYPATDLLIDMATWTPETICKAALQAKGVDLAS